MAMGDEQQQTKRSTSTGSSSPSSLRRRRNPPALTALPQQERELTSTMLPPPVVETDDRTPVSSQSSSSLEQEEEGDDDDDDDDDDVYDYDDEEELFLNSQEHMEFSEGEDINSDQLQEETEESDVDPDELSYEELIALEEMVGEENRGLPPEKISSYLHSYAPPCLHGNQPVHLDRCVICQAEYEEGEMRVALSCQHLYHSDCIRKWLLLRKTCPICGIEVSSSSNVAGTF
ncbi:E3 ubiquitin ligase BIG BROTHER-related-like isoform X1 [Diospyros lotus]|uniref:E3 ubiquitin ligase BIG BROTHER-related-like isoform X1 n=1 Tax=Diospyros lotus TaxID=55363 RepID=UPI0022585302|nr:E3 ubiquitin ligase BIG BROTHER-related-like isoform X1 [Diospyros lotus]